MQQLQPLHEGDQGAILRQEDKAITDQAAYQAKTMELYKEYGINPFAGCLPALIQIPLFITVYQFMLHYQFEFQKGYFLWINPSTSANRMASSLPTWARSTTRFSCCTESRCSLRRC